MRSVVLGLLVSFFLLSPLLGFAQSPTGDMPCDRILTEEGRLACYDLLLAHGAKLKGKPARSQPPDPTPLHAATTTDTQACQALVTYFPWFEVSWTAPTLQDATVLAYLLERQEDAAPAVSLAEFPPTILRHVDTTLKVGSRYQYGVLVRYARTDGTVITSPLYMPLSTADAPCVAVTALEPAGPLTGKVTSAGVDLTWPTIDPTFVVEVRRRQQRPTVGAWQPVVTAAGASTTDRMPFTGTICYDWRYVTPQPKPSPWSARFCLAS